MCCIKIKLCRKKHKMRHKIDGFISSITTNGITIRGKIKKMELREGQQVEATVSLTTASGHPAVHESGTESWESSDPDIASVTVNANDPLQATIVGVDGSNNGSVLITFRADGDPDADQVRDIVVTGDVVVTQGEAHVGSMTFGPPIDVP